MSDFQDRRITEKVSQQLKRLFEIDLFWGISVAVFGATITKIMKSTATSTSRTSTNCAPSLVPSPPATRVLRGLSMAYLSLPPGTLIASLIDPCNRAGAKKEGNVWTNDSDTELKCVLCMQGA